MVGIMVTKGDRRRMPESAHTPHEPTRCPDCGAPVIRRMTADGTVLLLEPADGAEPGHGRYVITGRVLCRPALPLRDEGELLYARHHHPTARP